MKEGRVGEEGRRKREREHERGRRRKKQRGEGRNGATGRGWWVAAQIQRQRQTEGGEERPGTHTKRVMRNNTERDRYVEIRDRRAGVREECESPSPSAAAPTLTWSAALSLHLLLAPWPVRVDRPGGCEARASPAAHCPASSLP